jgi:thiol:disulfide interchange protein
MLRSAQAALVALLLAASPAAAQFDATSANKLPARFAAMADVRVEVVPAKVKRGDTVTVKLSIDLKPSPPGTPPPGIHTYPFFPKDAGQISKNKIALPSVLTLLPGGTEPAAPKAKFIQREGATKGVLDEYYDEPVTWEFKARVAADAPPGPKDIDLGKTRLQVCDEQCVNAYGEHLPHLLFEVTGDPPVGGPDTPPKVNPEGTRTAPPVPAVVVSSKGGGPKSAKPAEVYAAELEAVRAAVARDEAKAGTDAAAGGDSGTLAFVLTAAAWGLISLVTPCVFPMIPITVSIFLKHAHGSFAERIKLAGVYCLTIIVVLGSSAFALLKFMAWLSAHPVTNVLMGALFFVLALSLFGMYELTLPNFLVQRLQKKQAKGGVVGTIFGALAFTVISFTCVAPFLGGFAGITSADSGTGSLISFPTTREILGGLAFATAFAAPFFVLAMVPGLLKALPRSGGWLDSVKVVMGFLELAAALKFFRTAEIRVLSPAEFFTYDLVLAGWVAMALACALYLLNTYRLPHDEEKPNIGVPRLLFAVLFLGLAFYLLPAMFKTGEGKAQRPAGAVYAWVQAFLLPDTELAMTDLKDAIEASRKSGKPVFVDFTGVTCTNCKYNEESVFTLPSVRGELEKFERVQLYTDWVPAEAYSVDPGKDARDDEGTANRRFQQALFGDIALPLYAVIVPLPDGKLKVVGGTFNGKDNSPFEGKINSPDKFAAWLKDALAKAKP